MAHSQGRLRLPTGIVVASLMVAALAGCRAGNSGGAPSIEFTRVPLAADGTPERTDSIEGRVTGARPKDRIVIFALSGKWWVQPVSDQPFTTIQADSKWKSTTHPGALYGALLVDERFRPPLTLNTLPERGGSIRAVSIVKGVAPKSPPSTLSFSGYQWEVRKTGSDAVGANNLFVPANAWTDESRFLHLRVSKHGDKWDCAEIKLSRSLGYGSYRFVVRDVSHLEAAAVLAMTSWDELGPPREMDIEISRYGEAVNKAAQFVVQPYLAPANVKRFTPPAGTLTYWLNWSAGRVAFNLTSGRTHEGPSTSLVEHVFTSGVPTAGNERIRISAYRYEASRLPLERDFEVIVEKFEFLP